MINKMFIFIGCLSFSCSLVGMDEKRLLLQNNADVTSNVNFGQVQKAAETLISFVHLEKEKDDKKPIILRRKSSEELEKTWEKGFKKYRQENDPKYNSNYDPKFDLRYICPYFTFFMASGLYMAYYLAYQLIYDLHLHQ